MSSRATRKPKDFAVAATDERQAVPGKADRRLADRVLDPSRRVVFEVREELRGDLAVARSCDTGVDDAEHQASAPLALRRDSGVGGRTPVLDGGPEARQSGEAVRQQIIENEKRGERLAAGQCGQRDVKAFASHLKPDERLVILKDYMGVHIFSGERGTIGRWACRQDDRSRIDLRGPEDRLD